MKAYKFTCKICGHIETAMSKSYLIDSNRSYPNAVIYDNGLEYYFCEGCGIMIKLSKIDKWIKEVN